MFIYDEIGLWSSVTSLSDSFWFWKVGYVRYLWLNLIYQRLICDKKKYQKKIKSIFIWITCYVQMLPRFPNKIHQERRRVANLHTVEPILHHNDEIRPISVHHDQIFAETFRVPCFTTRGLSKHETCCERN